VNQHLKRGRLASAAALLRAREGMVGWRPTAYLTDNLALMRRFGDELSEPAGHVCLWMIR